MLCVTGILKSIKLVRILDHVSVKRFKVTSHDQGEPGTPSQNASSQSKQALDRINLYCEHPKNTSHPFRAAEMRLENKITISRLCVGNNRSKICSILPNPVKAPEEAFHHKPSFLDVLNDKELFIPLPMQSQAWPVIMSGEDFVGVGGSDEDQRLAVLLPALLHIEIQREHRGVRKPTVVWLSACRESASKVKEEIKKYEYRDIECVCFGNDNDSLTSLASLENQKCEVIATTPDLLSKMIKTGKVEVDSISYVVLEKLDKILKGGFESEVKSILSNLQKQSSNIQIIVTSTTFCTDLARLMSLYQVDPVVVKVGFLDLTAIDGVTQNCRYEENETKRDKAIAYLSSLTSEDRIVIFCDNEWTVSNMQEVLIRAKLRCEEIRINTKIEDRGEILKKLKDGTSQVLVTNVPACDLDMTVFTHRYIYDFPKTIDEYITLISRRCDKDPGITTISILSENDWAIVPDLITVLRKTNQIVEPKLYELANRFKPVVFNEDPTFLQLAQSDIFVDKSMIIAGIVEESDQFLFTAARKMGKTAILRMIDCFFNIQGNKVEVKQIFEKLKIGQRPDIIEQHLCKHPILWVDMSHFSQVSIDSEKSCIEAMRQIVHKAYLKHEYLKNEHTIVEDWTDEKKYLKIPKNCICHGLRELAELLLKHYKKEVVLLCDEFDSICDTALSKEVDPDMLDSIIRTYFKLFTGLVKNGDERYLFRAIFTGVTAVTCSGASPLNTLQAYKFLESNQFSQYYGITKSEFDELLNRPQFEKLREEKELALAHYNGYKCYDGEQLLCTYSIVRYLQNYSKADRLQNYWKNSGSVERYADVFGGDGMQHYLGAIVNGSSVAVRRFDLLTGLTLAKISGGTSAKNFQSKNADILMVYLQQLGYFNIEEFFGNMLMVLRIPNEEIQQVFHDILAASLLKKLNLTTSQLNDCVQSLNELIDKNKTEAALKKLVNSLTFLCKSRPVINNELSVNEKTLEDIVYSALLLSKFKPLSQEKAKNAAAPEKNWNIFDACFYYKNFGILIEYKYGDSYNAKKALKQISEKKDHLIFNNDQLGIKFDKKLFVGMHVTKDGEVTFDHTDNISNDTS